MINLVFFSSGFISVIMQTLLLREMLVVFHGNELTIGVILSHWMLGAGLGGILTGSFEDFVEKNAKKWLMYSFLLNAAAFIVSFYLINNINHLVRIMPGQSIPFYGIIWSSFLVIFPVSFLAGTQFTLSVFILKNKEGINFPARIYLWESLGYLFGGLIFVFVLTGLFGSSFIVAGVSVFSCLAGILLYKGKIHKLTVAALFILAGLSLPLIANYLEKDTRQKVFSSFNVKEIINSPYGQIAAVGKNGEVQFFYNGVSQLSLPFEDTESNEEFAYLPLLSHQKPVNVLLFGGSGRYLKELLAYPGVLLDYVEQDKAYIGMVKKYWPANLKNEFNNPGLSVIYGGGRQFLRNSGKKYDVILIGYSDPETLSVNSYFTSEFFTALKGSLAENGIVAFKLQGSEVYMSKYLAGLLNIEKNTVDRVFKPCVILPGNNTIFIAKKDGAPAGASEMKKHLSEQKLDVQFLSEQYIDYRFDPQKQVRFSLELSNSKNIGINRDASPKGLVYALLYWQEVFAPSLNKAYLIAAKYSWLLWVIIFLWVLSKKGGYYTAAFTSGLAGMGIQMVIIFAVQVFYGNIYSLIGVLSALFMAGIAAGAGFAYKLGGAGNKNTLKIEAIYCLWIIVCFLCFKLHIVNEPVLSAISFITGVILGFELPVLISGKSKAYNISESKVSGRIYAFDLFGAWFSAIAFGAFLVPAWGIEKTLILLLMLKLISLKWFFSQKRYI